MNEKKQTNKIYDSKVFWAVVSLILSLIIWSYVSNITGATMDKTFSGVEVRFSGEQELLSERSLAITNVDTSSVTIKVRGSRNVIGKLNSTDIKAVVDVSGINQPNELSLSYDLQFPNGIDKSEFTVVSRNPDVINFTVVKNASITIPVKGSFEGTIADGCVADEIVFDPAEIVVEGPEEAIKDIDHAWLTFGKHEKIDATYSVDCEFELQDAQGNPIDKTGLSVSADRINATQPILKTKELPLTVNIIDGGGVTEADCKISIEPKSVTVMADSRLVDDKESIVLATIDLRSFQSSFEQTYSIPLGDEVDNPDGVSEATVKIEIPSVKVRTVTATNISCKNCSDGYEAIINSESVEVTLRSQDETALNAVRADEVSVVVDLADYGSTTGQVRANATAYVSGYENVGAIGEIKVLLTIQKD